MEEEKEKEKEREEREEQEINERMMKNTLESKRSSPNDTSTIRTIKAYVELLREETYVLTRITPTSPGSGE